MTLPAYSRALLEKRRHGLAPKSELMIATAWNLGRAWPWRIVALPEADPQTLDFSIVAGLSCLVAGHEQARMDAIARAVIPFDPLRLVGVRMFGSARTTIYVPGAWVPVAA